VLFKNWNDSKSQFHTLIHAFYDIGLLGHKSPYFKIYGYGHVATWLKGTKHLCQQTDIFKHLVGDPLVDTRDWSLLVTNAAAAASGSKNIDVELLLSMAKFWKKVVGLMKKTDIERWEFYDAALGFPVDGGVIVNLNKSLKLELFDIDGYWFYNDEILLGAGAIPVPNLSRLNEDEKEFMRLLMLNTTINRPKVEFLVRKIALVFDEKTGVEKWEGRGEELEELHTREATWDGIDFRNLTFARYKALKKRINLEFQTHEASLVFVDGCFRSSQTYHEVLTGENDNNNKKKKKKSTKKQEQQPEEEEVRFSPRLLGASVFLFENESDSGALPERHFELFDRNGSSKLSEAQLPGMALLRILNASSPVLLAIELGYGWPCFRQFPKEVGISTALSNSLVKPTEKTMWLTIEERTKWILGLPVFSGRAPSRETRKNFFSRQLGLCALRPEHSGQRATRISEQDRLFNKPMPNGCWCRPKGKGTGKEKVAGGGEEGSKTKVKAKRNADVKAGEEENAKAMGAGSNTKVKGKGKGKKREVKKTKGTGVVKAKEEAKTKVVAGEEAKTKAAGVGSVSTKKINSPSTTGKEKGKGKGKEDAKAKGKAKRYAKRARSRRREKAPSTTQQGKGEGTEKGKGKGKGKEKGGNGGKGNGSTKKGRNKNGNGKGKGGGGGGGDKKNTYWRCSGSGGETTLSSF
jgi:hypothetical protein